MTDIENINGFSNKAKIVFFNAIVGDIRGQLNDSGLKGQSIANVYKFLDLCLETFEALPISFFELKALLQYYRENSDQISKHLPDPSFILDSYMRAFTQFISDLDTMLQNIADNKYKFVCFQCQQDKHGLANHCSDCDHVYCKKCYTSPTHVCWH